MKLIEIQNLTKRFKRGKHAHTAINHLSLSINQGETLGLVGESGCGKSTLGKCMLRLVEPDEGSVVFNGVDILKLNASEMRRTRRSMQMIFQDPFASLNPRMTIEEILAEPLEIHSLSEGKKERIQELMQLVGLNPDHLGRYPHEFSGGQRQRIGIARALALNPKFIVCDEPLSALDVSTQAQIVNLLKGLQKQLGLTYLFIAHDLAMLESVADRVAVMYFGEIVELAPAAELYANPLHPYTKLLFSAIPVPDPRVARKHIPIPDTHLKFVQGCPFQHRCMKATEVCQELAPEWREVTPGHFVACHY